MNIRNDDRPIYFSFRHFLHKNRPLHPPFPP
jgi:hypothetical protein